MIVKQSGYFVRLHKKIINNGIYMPILYSVISSYFYGSDPFSMFAAYYIGQCLAFAVIVFFKKPSTTNVSFEAISEDKKSIIKMEYKKEE